MILKFLGEFDYKVTAKEAAVKILKDIGGIDNFNERIFVKCIDYIVHEISTYTGDINIGVVYSDREGKHYIANYDKETDSVELQFLFKGIGNTSSEPEIKHRPKFNNDIHVRKES